MALFICIPVHLHPYDDSMIWSMVGILAVIDRLGLSRYSNAVTGRNPSRWPDGDEKN
jgi:hypothetical protein